jgi:hypothetical protein
MKQQRDNVMKPSVDLGDEMHKLFIGHTMSDILSVTLAAAATAAKSMGMTKEKAVKIFAAGFEEV